MGPKALPIWERNRTLENRSGAVDARKHWARIRCCAFPVASSIIRNMKAKKTNSTVVTSRKFHLS